MKVAVFLKVKAVICLVYGLGMMTLPGILIKFYGVSLDAAGIYLANLFGVCLIGLSLICWFTSAARASDLKQNILLSLAITDTAGFGLTLFHQFSGVINILGWTTVALWLLFAAGCLIYRFLIKE